MNLVRVLAVCLAAMPTFASAQETPLTSYSAYIGEADLYNSGGERLTQPWQVIRQDRANYHRFGQRDQGDEYDPFFELSSNRDYMERLIAAGRIDGDAARAIVEGGRMIDVTVYPSHVTVDVR